MYQPDFEPLGIPDGHYVFTVKGRPELNRRQSKRGEFVAPTYIFEAEDKDGDTYRYKQSFTPWDPCYQEFLLVIGGTPDEKGRIHAADLDPDGKAFRAEIWQEPDRNDPNKSWARMREFKMVDADWPKGEAKQGSLPTVAPEDDDIPF